MIKQLPCPYCQQAIHLSTIRDPSRPLPCPHCKESVRYQVSYRKAFIPIMIIFILTLGLSAYTGVGVGDIFNQEQPFLLKLAISVGFFGMIAVIMLKSAKHWFAKVKS